MTDTSWDPEKYRQFGDERARPAWDLMNRMPEREYVQIVDLGCGAGEQAIELKQRWPDAHVTGVDSSPEMLEEAKSAETCGVKWHEADIAVYEPEAPLDLVYSNAALQWLGGHSQLFSRLAQWLMPGGVLAVQMPRNYDAPSHQIMRAIAASGQWASSFNDVQRLTPVGTPEFYYEVLSPHVSELDIWETTYLQVLDGGDPVAHWTRSTGLRPFLNALADEAEREKFFATYADALRSHYPRQPDGKTLFPFQRLFIVAQC